MLGRAMVFAACLVLAVPSLAGSVAGDEQQRRVVRVLQLNLCASGIAGCYTGRSVAEAAAVIRATRPDIVTLNEICDGDVARLERVLAEVHRDGAGSAFMAAPDRRTGGPTRCRGGSAFGIGLLVPASIDASTVDSGVYPVQDLGDPELRVWLCAPTAGLHACTTHLANTSATVALAQCRYLLGVAVPAVHARRGYRPTVVGGDLNLRDDAACPGTARGYVRTSDGNVQHVLAAGGVAVGARATVDMAATTDHAGLLVTLVVTRPAAERAAGRRARRAGR